MRKVGSERIRKEIGRGKKGGREIMNKVKERE